jgi:transposase
LKGARYVFESQYRNRRRWHRYWQEIIGLDKRGAIVLRQKWSRSQVEARLANTPPCLIGMEACVGAHHLSRKLQALGHDARLIAPGATLPAHRIARHTCQTHRRPVATHAAPHRGTG